MSLPQIEDKNLNQLTQAIRHNDVHSLSSLLDAHPGIANRDYGSKHPTLLHFAIWLDSAKSGSAVCYDIYRLLVRHGADANITDRNGQNCLLYALQYPIIRHDPHAMHKLVLLVENTRDLNYVPPGFGQVSPLVAALRVGSTVSIAELLLHRFKVNPNIPILYPGGRKMYPISCALLNHVRTSAIELILSQGADLSLPEKNDFHPLFLCVEHTKMPLHYLNTLLQHGIDVNAKNLKGQNALQILLQKQIDPPTIRSKIQCLVDYKIDTRVPITVGFNNGETISLLHYIILDGISAQHSSDATTEIAQQLLQEYTESNYEHAKMTFHRSKSIRSRESTTSLTLITRPTSPNLNSPLSADASANPTTPRRLSQGKQPSSLSRLTSPRASEHSLRFVDKFTFSPTLLSPTDPVTTQSDYATPRPLHSNFSFLSPPPADSLTLTMNDLGLESHRSGHGLPSGSIGTEFVPGFDEVDPAQVNHTRELAHHSFGDHSTQPLIRQGSDRSNASHSSTESTRISISSLAPTLRSQRSYATMSYAGLNQETVTKLVKEKEQQDALDADTLLKIIDVAMDYIIVDANKQQSTCNDNNVMGDSDTGVQRQSSIRSRMSDSLEDQDLNPEVPYHDTASTGSMQYGQYEVSTTTTTTTSRPTPSHQRTNSVSSNPSTATPKPAPTTTLGQKSQLQPSQQQQQHPPTIQFGLTNHKNSGLVLPILPPRSSRSNESPQKSTPLQITPQNAAIHNSSSSSSRPW